MVVNPSADDGRTTALQNKWRIKRREEFSSDLSRVLERERMEREKKRGNHACADDDDDDDKKERKKEPDRMDRGHPFESSSFHSTKELR